MDIQIKNEARADAVAVMASEGATLLAAGKALDDKAQGALTRAMQASRFEGRAGQVLEILAPANLDFPRLLVIGVGALDKADPITVERWAGHAVKRTLTTGAESLALHVEGVGGVAAAEAAARAAVGARLAAYRFDRYRTKVKPDQKPSLKDVTVVTEGAAGAKGKHDALAAVAEGVFFARDLVSEPPNVLHPPEFANRLKAMESLGLEVTVLDVAEMTKLGMGALLGVGQGSVRESRLVVMSWKGAKNKAAQPICFVGKGVTFDTGGISLKPGAGMDEMKGDMGGAAAVSGVMMALAKRKAKANVIGVVGLVENMPDGNAQRPGDIVTSMSGQTIEVLNTDAEGRLVLCDAMWYAQEKFNPTAIVDLATLTGAIIISLGHEHAGLFSNNDALAADLTAAGLAEGEAVWRLPLAPAYDKMIDSPNADIKNISGKPAAGSITAAQFLQRFVKDGVAWAHLDIAGTAWKPAPYEDPTSPGWATGFGVRLLNRLVASRYEE
ncbi:MAG: leucyl aminopeptidase [Hyphomonadaceae bacterium]|nr:leucyl aminopeptidase [Hyphomonadaceae bacterium]